MIHSRVKAEKALKRSLRKTLPGLGIDYNWVATCLWLDVVQPMLKAEAESHKISAGRCGAAGTKKATPRRGLRRT